MQRANKDTFSIVIMECLLPPRVDAVFDLKGSIAGRRKLKHHLARTIEDIPAGTVCKDLDFLNIQSSFQIKSADFSKLQRTLEADVGFLSVSRLMDYSLLVGVCRGVRLEEGYERCGVQLESGYVLYIGIIDYLQRFNYRKRIETWGRTIQGKRAPSCVSPSKYGRRFYAFMISIFKSC